jgi:hypothetical protein
MPVFNFLAFSNSDLGRAATSISTGTFTVSGKPAVMSVQDNDTRLDDEATNGGQTLDTSQQRLASVFDGIYATNRVVQSVYSYDVLNTTTGEVGKAYLIRIYTGSNPNNPGNQSGEYYNAFNIGVNVGDTIVLTNGNFIGQTAYSNLVICFTENTAIATPRGPRAIQTLRPGDMVMTRDDGAQPLAWIGTRTVAATTDLAPIEIAAGVLGNSAALRVSPNHRMLITAATNDLHFGTTEVFVAAKHLIGNPGVCSKPGGQVTYIHLLFDRHQVVYANNAPSESLFPGASALTAMDRAARAEVLHLFPELANNTARNFTQTARLCLNRRESALLHHAHAL